ADGEPVIVADDRDQLFLRKAGLLVDLHAIGAEDLRGLGIHLVRNQYLGHVLHLRRPGARPGASSSMWGVRAARARVRGQADRASWKAQSSHGPSASMSSVSIVAPHQMRMPGGASR